MEKEALFSGYSCYKGLDWCMLLGISNGCFRLVCIHWKEFIKTKLYCMAMSDHLFCRYFTSNVYLTPLDAFLYFILLYNIHSIQVLIFKRLTLEYSLPRHFHWYHMNMINVNTKLLFKRLNSFSIIMTILMI